MKKLVCIGGGEIPRYKNGILLPYETKEYHWVFKIANYSFFGIDLQNDLRFPEGG